MKPILFNTEMVRAILDNKKKTTRRIAKKIPPEAYKVERDEDGKFFAVWGGYLPDMKAFIDGSTEVKPSCQVDDILYVRETWQLLPSGFDEIPPEMNYIYKATHELSDECTRWRPSLHMPKGAARIFLKVTDVRAERLQNITEGDALNEGVGNLYLDEIAYSNNPKYETVMEAETLAREQYELLWNSTIKNKDLAMYGWEANPWVWVIEFERREKPGGTEMNGCKYEYEDRQCHHPSVIKEEGYVDWCVEGLCHMQESEEEARNED